ncbi:Receptor-like serine/threonine-protein kinase SD1-8 [Striga hermonthica]|uniref:Receptor-like serine/threonine-protein kinase n=1 Tax=Striga hermonthica TaxID=68872 RepID=A0A9N7RLI7_STRHE|nr:Receptor-like serine/threonine-protein kinase SD1-8 [Striga hermonthica]
MTVRHRLLSILAAFSLFPILATPINLITGSQFLTVDRTLVSAGQEFELGFFPSAQSNGTWYVGIWYKKIPERTVVWVANRDAPLRSSSGSLRLDAGGNLVLLDGERSIWSTGNPGMAADAVAELLDTGNLVLRSRTAPAGDYLWQSFDHPTDTLLPGMKLGWDAKSGLNRNITSWRAADDPSTGHYTFRLNTSGFPEIFLSDGRSVVYRSGPWNGLRFSGVPEMNASPLFSFVFVAGPEEVYYTFRLNERSVYSRLVVSHAGAIRRYTWAPSIGLRWNLFWYAPKDQCDGYRACGAHGICDASASPVCRCLTDFRPKDELAWGLRDGSGGCVREVELDCRSDGFLRMGNVKLPESGAAVVDRAARLDRCREMCHGNCKCRGYASANISGGGGGSGCVMWAGDLYDMRQYAAAEGGQDFYLRVPAADLAAGSGDHLNKAGKIIEIVGISAGSFLFAVAIFFVWKRRKSKKASIGNSYEQRGPRERSRDLLMNASTIPSKQDHSGENVTDELDLPLFDISTLITATKTFSDSNKLGQGGFGSVYKGVLEGGQEIAVKRLSQNSGQGLDEFMNEVKLIARLQHRNLVRLLGCCVDMEEKMLIYEYMENKSLDSILFKKEKRSMLDWPKRFDIICGIARGLLYLHQDSRFRIIHRDLKASNVLLDKEMHPKISDFGMARIFGGDQTEASTKKVVGTYGYMSPEYAMDGLFSVKSDVFSFGVLVLEIVSGTKNRGFYQTNNELNLLAYAWKLYREGKGLELMDSSVKGGPYSVSEVMRCIQVGLLCVQEHADDRPNMSTILLMLSSDIGSIQEPKHPGYCLGRRPIENESSSSRQDETFTVNEVTVTMLEAR